MSSTERERLLPTTEHIDYQSLGPPEPPEEQVVFYKRKLVWVLFGILGFICLVASSQVFDADKQKTPLYSNGTHTFAPTVIFISLDGTVNHDLDLDITPNLRELGQRGVKAKYMTPSFPPITFPNHWSLVTGLYPESHGVVGNYFYDSHLNDSFYYKSPDKSWDEKWWGGEPIWITAVRQNVKSAVIMWPGCSTEFKQLRPTYTVAFSDHVKFEEKVNQVFDWIDLPIEDRPQFMAVYVPEIDQAGHAYGPYADETKKQLKLADYQVGKLMRGLEARNLTNIVNVIIVSDHGMSETSPDRLIYYDTALTSDELDLIWRIEAEPTFGIRPLPYVNQEEAVEILYQAFKRLQKHEPHFQVYKREDFPDRFHFKHNVRIPPLLVLPDPGWNFVDHHQYDPKRGIKYALKGVHGYDNLSPESRAIFVAQGPNFPRDKVLAPFVNVELYNVVSKILHLEPSVNNGTLNGVLETI